ncbi:MAG: trypsin-like peptidase domain-containing protein [Saprospiraceae bacterium]|nr:trypsin-like peptidase domain-containing protein [Saprospiraceae bacterium]MBK6564323.1 trypsin-like peptidase domain-containing protein [Saprospiraceae bacterium]MBK7523995.1 trypsin-like peptidase domain-containing protein [Saprospiraceae bacterium]MBK8079038.1 trypsin-like peptidase domain-containing protein [Saprospiraceae bacterium]MBK8372047.1 trypsin-like peptidase domain-containing protein [Saprospiraceae bacterium]
MSVKNKLTDIIEKSRKSIIQIATPYYTGTGFCLKGYDLIITNEHVVTGNKKVIVKGKNDLPVLSEIIYLDTFYDIAFIKKPSGYEKMGLPLCNKVTVLREGMNVVAMGHPFGLPFSVTKGIISNLSGSKNEVSFIQHDAALNPGNSGGPLLDEKGMVIGINSFNILNGQNIGFALPYTNIIEIIDEFIQKGQLPAVRCNNCKQLLLESDYIDEKNFCLNCGSEVQFIKDVKSYEPHGVCWVIEKILKDLGIEIEVTRKGPNSWTVKQGSAVIDISYHEKTGVISAEAILCLVPQKNVEELYYYILKQNAESGGLTFSVKDNMVIISFLVYDQFLSEEILLKYMKNLFKKTDVSDDILIKKFGGQATNQL